MKKYKVIMPDHKYEIIEAEYFTMVYDGHSGYNAYFKTTNVDVSRPHAIEESLVGFAFHPAFIVEVQGLDTDDSGA